MTLALGAARAKRAARRRAGRWREEAAAECAARRRHAHSLKRMCPRVYPSGYGVPGGGAVSRPFIRFRLVGQEWRAQAVAGTVAHAPEHVAVQLLLVGHLLHLGLHRLHRDADGHGEDGNAYEAAEDAES